MGSLGDRRCQGLGKDSGVQWLLPWGGCGGSLGAYSPAPGWVPTAFAPGSCAPGRDSSGDLQKVLHAATSRRWEQKRIYVSDPSEGKNQSLGMVSLWLGLGNPHIFPFPDIWSLWGHLH